MTSELLFTGYLALAGAQRLFELLLSRRNARLAFAQGGRELGAPHFKMMAAMHVLFLLCAAGEVLWLRRPFLPWLGGPAIAVALGAQGLRIWAIRTLGPRWNVRIIVLPGAMPTVRGPYRFIRHPNYLAVYLEMAAIPLIHTAWLTALLFSLWNAAVLRVRIPAEEAALGALYAQEFAGRPRFIPGA